MGNHALLSASSSHRWLNCPPSARLGENYEDKGSDFAAEGTDAHSLCEHKLKTALGIPSEDPTENLTWYNEEMEECASGYAAYVLELLVEAKKVTTDPIVLIEQRLDYSKYVESGFGTGDCVLIADGTLNIVDYKHGKGVEVSADHNPQMMLYVADFSAIEARVIAWFAGETWRQEVFAEGKDIYCASASQMFRVPVEKHGINGHLRQKGKIAELALGYGGSVGALKAMGALEMGLTEEELSPLVQAWRSANPNIVRFWWDVDRAVLTAVRGKTTAETHGIRFLCRSGMLSIILPSSRTLNYVKNHLPDLRQNLYASNEQARQRRTVQLLAVQQFQKNAREGDTRHDLHSETAPAAAFSRP